jgi:polyisoprenoid-binding protein YceI
MSSRGLVLIGALVGVVVLAGGAWYLLVGGEDPAAVSLDEAVGRLQSPTASGSPGGTTAGTPAAASTGSASSGSSAARSWSIDAANSFVGYRVVEELVGIGANTAVGRTSALSGDLSYDGRAITDLEVKADMRQLKSDDNRRDNFLRRQSLESDRYPDATFVLAEPIAVAAQPAEGASMSATARGDLTLHGVTKRIEIPVEGRLTGGKLVVVGSTRIPFADYSISPPRAQSVISVEDVGVLEVSLVFQPASG